MIKLITVPPSDIVRMSDHTESFAEFCREVGLDLGQDYVLYFTDWYSATAAKYIVENFGKPVDIISDVEGSINTTSDLAPRFIPALNSGMFNVIELYRDYQSQNAVMTNYCCNFSVIKPNLDRQIFLKILEWFRISSCRYTWSGYRREFDAGPVLDSINQLQDKDINDMHEFRRHVLSPIGDWFQPTWHDSYTGKLVSYDPAQQQRTLGEVWEGYRSDMISTTAVSLLTESCSWNEPNFVFTEKTFFAVFGLTFPIWVGNHGQADQFEDMGFDTFPDVINHDYQFYPDLFDRVYWAIKLNLPLLTDIDLARTARRQHLPRLISNRAHLFSPEYLDWLISCYQDLDTTILQQLLCVPRQESALTVKLQHSLSVS